MPETRKSSPKTIDFPNLAFAVRDLTHALERGKMDEKTVAALIAGATPRDSSGRRIPGLEDAHWEEDPATPQGHAWNLRAPQGHVVARIVHGKGKPRWTASVWSEADGQLE